MVAYVWTGLWLSSVVAAATLQLTSPGSGVMAVFAGLWLVVGGTVLMARIGQSRSLLGSFRQCAAGFAAPQADRDSREDELKWFLEAANLFRYGSIRPAEAAAQRISDPLLKRGTQLVLDGYPREQVTIALQRQIAEDRDRYRSPIDLLHSLSGYAPTLGMLGTLLGLVQMLFGLSAGNLDTVGASMGFGMLTTVYGLVLANLVFKPLANKLEQSGRDRIARSATHLHAIMMLYDREHSALIREVLGGSRTERASAPAPLPFSPIMSR